jgi:hypothetical protein
MGGRIISKRIVKEQDVTTWPGLMWLSIRSIHWLF